MQRDLDPRDVADLVESKVGGFDAQTGS